MIYKSKSIPASISASAYDLDMSHKWIFSIILILCGFLIAPELLEITSKVSPGNEFLSFFTIAGIMGVGTDPLVHGKKNIIHYISAILLGICSQIIVLLVNPYIFLLWIPYILYTLYMENGKWNMLFGEIIMILNLLACDII